MAIEYELKYRANPAALKAIQQAVAGHAQTIAMETTYYDTPSGSLSQRRYTLRRRMENGASVCTLKAPVSGPGRGEWELSCTDIEAAAPALCKLGAPADLQTLAQEGLIPVCGAKFTRTAKTVLLPDCTVEVALDTGFLSGGGRTEPLCEVEVELKSGDPAACTAYAMELAAQFGLEPEPHSKFRRALALYQGG